MYSSGFGKLQKSSPAVQGLKNNVCLSVSPLRLPQGEAEGDEVRSAFQP